MNSVPSILHAQERAKQTDFSNEEHYHQQKCIPDEVRAQIKQQIEINRTALIRSGKLKPVQNRMPPMFIWPLRQADHVNYPGFYAISNYVDHDATGGLLDYNCGARTYDGHRGTDVRIVPFRWNKMANDEVEIIAAADGVIILKQDGNQDMNCQWGLGTPWNAVFVQHADGTVTWYGHMKSGSTTEKDSGDALLPANTSVSSGAPAILPEPIYI